MTTTAIPDGYHSFQAYLIYTDCAAAMAFMTSVFEATARMCMKSPEDKVQHAEMQIGDSVLMMADENPSFDAFAVSHYGGSPISLVVYVENADATYAKALEAGATSVRGPADQSHGDRLAGFLDPFGYTWWVQHRLPKPQEGGSPE